MAESGFEKTEDPTPRRLAEARRDGNIAQSRDLTAAVMLLATVVLLHLLGMKVLAGMKAGLHWSLTAPGIENATRTDGLRDLAVTVLEAAVKGLAPLLLAIAAVGLVAQVMQVGFLITGKPITPQFSRVSPLKGVKNLVGLRAAMRGVMSIGKVAVIAAVAVIVIVEEMPQIIALAGLEVGQAFIASSGLVFSLSLKLAAVLLVLAILDYAYQKWQRQQDLRMTKQELKEEMRSMDGDPMVKQRRARVARQLAMQRMAAAVPKADVVVTNPTHYSVALRYDKTSMRAPKVVAKGADFMAMRIRQIASIHGVPLVERKPLARALYANVEVGQEVPEQHYAAVAEILAYVYRISKRAG